MSRIGSSTLTKFTPMPLGFPTVIQCDSYFDVGIIETTFTLVEKCNLVIFGGTLMKVLGPQTWSKLPRNIQESTSVNAFKKEVKSFYFDQYIT